MLDTKLVYQDLAARSPDGERFRLEPDTSITNWMLGAGNYHPLVQVAGLLVSTTVTGCYDVTIE